MAKIRTLTETEINLAEIGFKYWPDEAKEMARVLIQKPGMAAKMQQQLFPLSWLAGEVDKLLEAQNELRKEFRL